MKEFVACSCEKNEHHLILSQEEEEEGLLYISVHLQTLPFWQRLKLAIKYLFGYRSRYGEYAEIILDTEKIKQLKDYLG